MILLRWFITALTVFALPHFINDINIDTSDSDLILTAMVVSACLVFLHLVIKPIISLLTLPLNILTLGLFSVILNGAFFWFVSKIITGFSISTFTAAVIGALVITIINWIVGKFIND